MINIHDNPDGLFKVSEFFFTIFFFNEQYRHKGRMFGNLNTKINFLGNLLCLILLTLLNLKLYIVKLLSTYHFHE